MALENDQQLGNILKSARNALLLMPEDPTGDSIGATWAMYFFLKKNGIDAMVICGENSINIQRFSFLAKPEEIIPSLSGARDFVLSFDTKFNKINEVRTEREGDMLHIFITPEKGSIDPRDFSFIPAKFKFDLVIVLGSADKESLGKVYEENPDIFYEVPVVNIDYHSENENFGQLNIVDIKASSTSEVVAELIKKIEPKFLDENIAECLLSGIIDETNSFQKRNTTPKSLEVSASLMAKGADQQKIIRYLYKTQPLHLLKLWGRVMARLYWEESLHLAWAPVYLEDFVQSRSNPSDVPFILERIKENYSAGKIFMVLYNENSDAVRGVIKCSNWELMKVVAEILGTKAVGDTCVFQEQAGDTTEAGQRIVEKLKAKLIEQ